jgi:hypothetical protein
MYLRTRFYKILLVLSAMLFSSDFVLANSFRCNTHLVLPGDTTYQVKKKCGNPDDEEKIGYVKFDDEYINVTMYTYDLGHGKFLRTLEFHNGILFSITDGPRT